MDTILWSQSETVTGVDNLLVDGKPCEPEKRRKVMDFLLNNRNFTNRLLKIKRKGHQWYPLISYFKEVIDECIKRGEVVSSNLICYIDDEGCYLIQARFNEKDETGRNTVYCFYANTTDIDCALQQLEEVSALIGKTCKPMDLVAIKKAKQKADEKKNISRIVLISLIVLIICAIIMYLS